MAFIEFCGPGIAANQWYTGAGTNYVVHANNGYWYMVFGSSGDNDLYYMKSLDRQHWSLPIVIAAGITVQAVSVWYGRWSGLSDDKIHIAYTDSAGSLLRYASLDTSTDTLSTPVTVFTGVSAGSGGALSIVKDRAGNLRIAGSIDAGAEDGAWSSTDSGASWGDTIADPSEGATQDQYFLLPGWNADTSDFMLIFWDASANELSVKRYDDSANTWTETSIATSMNDTLATTAWAGCAVVCDVANSHNWVMAWTQQDVLNGKLRIWKIDDTSITEMTNVVSASTDDQGFACLSLDTSTGYLYAIYAGKTDGSETFNSSMNLYYKVSTDGGSTWGSETPLTTTARALVGLFTIPRFSGNLLIGRWISNSTAAGFIWVTEEPADGGGGPSFGPHGQGASFRSAA